MELGLRAARMACWEGLEPWQVRENGWLVHMWPEHIWDAAATGLLGWQEVPVTRDPGWPPMSSEDM
jgi:hypothetical protein